MWHDSLTFYTLTRNCHRFTFWLSSFSESKEENKTSLDHWGQSFKDFYISGQIYECVLKHENKGVTYFFIFFYLGIPEGFLFYGHLMPLFISVPNVNIWHFPRNRSFPDRCFILHPIMHFQTVVSFFTQNLAAARFEPLPSQSNTWRIRLQGVTQIFVWLCVRTLHSNIFKGLNFFLSLMLCILRSKRGASHTVCWLKSITL